MMNNLDRIEKKLLFNKGKSKMIFVNNLERLNGELLDIKRSICITKLTDSSIVSGATRLLIPNKETRSLSELKDGVPKIYRRHDIILIRNSIYVSSTNHNTYNRLIHTFNTVEDAKKWWKLEIGTRIFTLKELQLAEEYYKLAMSKITKNSRINFNFALSELYDTYDFLLRNNFNNINYNEDDIREVEKLSLESDVNKLTDLIVKIRVRNHRQELNRLGVTNSFKTELSSLLNECSSELSTCKFNLGTDIISKIQRENVDKLKSRIKEFKITHGL